MLVDESPLLDLKIKRPRQIAQSAAWSRTGHNTLRSQMNMSAEDFDTFVNIINESVDNHLDVSLPWTQQSADAKSAHISEVAQRCTLMDKYDGYWPVEAYTTKFAKLASRQSSKPASTQDKVCPMSLS
ncbi:uncharacterized protein B0H18DRAFT_977938 [Fomitopsis serialis]|uniref:uncharacterized protein n=1 Tax=Fomitopsis serialis TaxID=139415 RepID=UPI002008E76C|nr:uncharacterized protein B0H18DRAFT_977938 [Neoantrodia serialis]KAH9934727.1 hypothetical protein B0H18DRAFT_977938 [Neoantrodia serialis]